MADSESIHRYSPSNPDVLLTARTGIFYSLLSSIPIGAVMFLALLLGGKQISPINQYLALGVAVFTLLIVIQEISRLVKTSDIAIDEQGLRLIVLDQMMLPLGIAWLNVPAWHIRVTRRGLENIKIIKRHVDNHSYMSAWDKHPKQWSEYVVCLKQGGGALWCTGLFYRVWSPAFVVTSLHENHEEILRLLRAS